MALETMRFPGGELNTGNWPYVVLDQHRSSTRIHWAWESSCSLFPVGSSGSQSPEYEAVPDCTRRGKCGFLIAMSLLLTVPSRIGNAGPPVGAS